MSDIKEIQNDPNYKIVHEHGFVGLVDWMGSDEMVAKAARNSYQKGTKTVNDDRNLIRHLVKHRHSSPLEFGELSFHIRLPIFVMRQLVRHRTANLNECSARYSELPGEFYVPDDEYMQPQSTTNKQGRSGEIDLGQKSFIKGLVESAHEYSYNLYQKLLTEGSIGESYPGLARELSRIVLPVSIYTECYWKCDMKNFLHFCGLRLDKHAQREIRDFAQVMYDFAKQKFPILCEAAEDYQFHARTFSRMELVLLKGIIKNEYLNIYGAIDEEEVKSEAHKLNMSKREITEFLEFIKC